MLVEQILTYQKKIQKLPFVLSIAGYPSTGKTTLSERIQRILGVDRVTILGSECCILSGEERAKSNLSGCSLEAHDLSVYIKLIQTLLSGQTINVQKYNWESHSRSGPEKTYELNKDGWLIVEGPIPCHQSIAYHCDLVLFFKPINSESWLRNAINRDVKERNYLEADAKRLNNLKAKDIESIFKLSQGNIDYVVSVEYRENEKTNLVYNIDKIVSS